MPFFELSRNETACGFALRQIQARQRGGSSLEDAARWFRRTYPARFERAVEDLGSWPSSEPEFRAIQRIR